MYRYYKRLLPPPRSANNNVVIYLHNKLEKFPARTLPLLKAQYSQSSPFREPRYVGQVRRPELEERHRHPAPRGLRYETSDRGLALMESCLQVLPPSSLLATIVTMMM